MNLLEVAEASSQYLGRRCEIWDEIAVKEAVGVVCQIGLVADGRVSLSVRGDITDREFATTTHFGLVSFVLEGDWEVIVGPGGKKGLSGLRWSVPGFGAGVIFDN